MMMVMTENTRSKMKEFLASLIDSDDGWIWIGRTAYKRGGRGTFRLELWSDCKANAIEGVVGTYLPHNGGPADRVVFRFGDLITSTNPTRNPHYRGEAVSASDLTWDWGIARPSSLVPLHDAIRDWTMVHEITKADLDEMAADDARAAKRRPRKAS